MERDERRRRTEAVVKRRENLLRSLGMQGGTIYEKHRRKVSRSGGYMRDGNVSHYAAIVPTGKKIKTRSRRQFWRTFWPSVRDKRSMADAGTKEEGSDE